MLIDNVNRDSWTVVIKGSRACTNWRFFEQKALARLWQLISHFRKDIDQAS